MITAMVYLKVRKGALSRVASELSAIEEVVEVYSITGAYDLLAHVQVHEYDNLSDVVNDGIAGMPGVKGTRTVTASAKAGPRFAKRGQLLPRERLGLLLDAGAPFLELSACAGFLLDVPEMYRVVDGFLKAGIA